MTPIARIVRGGNTPSALRLLEPGISHAPRRRIAREELAARIEAERILFEAREEAESLLAQARLQATEAAAAARHEAEEQAQTELAARWLALQSHQEQQPEADVQRVIALAVALAERLLGASLELDPGRVVHLARAVIAEARGARRAVVDAHPLDAAALREQLMTAGLDVQSIEVRDDGALSRGELRLHTDVGTIDARLAPRFERLAAALRDALK
ncbi:MAG TPA: FliH/SctL family protein [Polyangiaceae bacterium]|nr:FliH/SctL family protein [Polyangiaceae bacterium]